MDVSVLFGYILRCKKGGKVPQSYSQTSFNVDADWKLSVRIMIKVNIVWNRELLGPRELSVTERFVARGKFASTNQKHYTDLARNTSISMGKPRVRSQNVGSLLKL